MRFRLFHDFFHILILPFSVLVLAGALNPSIKEVVEKADLLVHIVFFIFALESVYEWFHHRKHPHEK